VKRTREQENKRTREQENKRNPNLFLQEKKDFSNDLDFNDRVRQQQLHHFILSVKGSMVKGGPLHFVCPVDIGTALLQYAVPSCTTQPLPPTRLIVA